MTIASAPPAQLTMQADPDPVVVLHPLEAELYGLKAGDVFLGAKVVVQDRMPRFGDRVDLLTRALEVQ